MVSPTQLCYAWAAALPRAVCALIFNKSGAGAYVELKNAVSFCYCFLESEYTTLQNVGLPVCSELCLFMPNNSELFRTIPVCSELFRVF